MTRPTDRDEALDEQYSGVWSRHGEDSSPSAADFLANHPDASPSERLDVLLTEQLLRWRQGCSKIVDDYLEEHPDLAGDPEAILKLVQGEFLARLEPRRCPTPARTCGGFPIWPRRSAFSVRSTGG